MGRVLNLLPIRSWCPLSSLVKRRQGKRPHSTRSTCTDISVIYEILIIYIYFISCLSFIFFVSCGSLSLTKLKEEILLMYYSMFLVQLISRKSNFSDSIQHRTVHKNTTQYIKKQATVQSISLLITTIV